MGLISETGASFDAAAFENFTTSFAGVAFHKSMFNFALFFVGLISSFGHKISYKNLLLSNTCHSITNFSTFFKKFSTIKLEMKVMWWKKYICLSFYLIMKYFLMSLVVEKSVIIKI